MKTKKKTYILLVAVIGIWSAIAFRIVSALNPDIPETNKTKLAHNSNFKVNTKVDTFSIQRVDRDPFLGTYYKTKTLKKTTKKPIKTPVWKPIEYLGLIGNKTNQIFIVSINNKQLLFKRGQTLDSVKVIRGNTKQVTVKYKNQTKTFRLKE